LRTGRLRRDLYDRLSVIQIDVPPLRAGRGDAAEIAAEVFAEVVERFGLPPTRLSVATLARMNALPWPGNVRQLTNVLRRMALAPAAAGGHGPDLPNDVLSDVGPDEGPREEQATGGSFVEIERRAILNAISRHGGSVQKAAEELELAASTIYRKLKAWQEG
jgi:DNA-binding NtrC family response regulator